ncbi:iron chelate uptake ABC transporter, FeCT family, permease protein [Aeromicrobium marinum DSM 15272]|uniref:Iron chelate uptake ABC transporter, FeCT family, permease protein n=1 Tax=Aeromicrobium marinum DSM 15272 TaxID=585531 RepID=E2S8H0_9ACTN|nr:iron chelate uptake ABC transporter family permease subunit [Aeromicrobium marinum]EFQ84475.1 iron chelate uptake ABC transporter, FeCT family, permease protein [Aeromicrobium marinum DSM 15272]
MTALVDETPAPVRRPHLRGVGRPAGLLVVLGVLAVVCFLSISLGSRGMTLGVVLDAFTGFDPDDPAHVVVRDLRVPRTILGLTVGAALGLSGTILQGLTRNPLADPGIMGINAGAAAFIVVGVSLLDLQGLAATVWFGFAGAAAATVLVYSVASFGREGATPVKLALAGAAVTAGMFSITSAVIMTDLAALNELRFWQVGSLAGRYQPVVEQTVPFMVLGIVLALGTGRVLNGLALGEDVAAALGQRVRLSRITLFAVVAVLCGAAVAACGPIVFVGLIVPHVARLLCGPDYRWILAYALLISPIVLLVADIVGRVVVSPGELQVGVVLGVLGAPAFIALVRAKNVVQL